MIQRSSDSSSDPRGARGAEPINSHFLAACFERLKAKFITMDEDAAAAAVDEMIDECDVNNDGADEILTQMRQDTSALLRTCFLHKEALFKNCVGRTQRLSDVIAEILQ